MTIQKYRKQAAAPIGQQQNQEEEEESEEEESQEENAENEKQAEDDGINDDLEELMQIEKEMMQFSQNK